VAADLKGVGGGDGGEALAEGGSLGNLLLTVVHVVNREHHLDVKFSVKCAGIKDVRAGTCVCVV
jgi:hypothetical protein